ncbi:MAG: glycosyltransferase family 39 protein [Bacteroidales bacterium]|nr:glycosyltransferase family 39 protein [Candidatus Latescibacterota bacterium]
MSNKNQVALAVLVLLAILALHLSIAWQDIATLSRNGFLYDDSFYAFQIARNIADGNGITFDGVNPTTGFQPLYVFMLVPAFMIAGESLSIPIYIALSMLALFTVMTAYLVYRIARKYTEFMPAVIAAAIWGLSPIVAKQGTNGLETAVSTFMIALSVFYYLDRIRHEARPGVFRFFVFGMLLGITVLSRIDGVFLVFVLILDYLLLLRKRRGTSGTLVRMLLLPAGVALFYGPWLLLNMAQCGSPLQDSGTATRFLSMAYATYFENGDAGLAVNGPDLAFIWEHVKHSIATMKVIPPVHVFFRSLEKTGDIIHAKGFLQITGNILGIVALVLSGIVISRWKRDPDRARRRQLDFLLLFCGLLMLSYSLYVFGAFFFLRYFYPVYMISCIFFSFILEDIIVWFRARSVVLQRTAISVATAYALLFMAFTGSQVFRSQPVYPFYDIARWVNENTEKGERIGVFQCGMIGYFSDREIINLDGKVNRDALCALKTGSLSGYIQKERLDMILDHSRILQIFLDMTPEKIRECCIKVLPEEKHPCGWVALRRDALDIITSTDIIGGSVSEPGMAPMKK